MMKGRFQWLDSAGGLQASEDSDDIPDTLTELIMFVPDIPREPHTQADHNLIETFVPKMKEFMDHARRNKNR